ncbi:MAG: N-6 DNA methylase [Candidatus Aminicenantales bacterium]
MSAPKEILRLVAKFEQHLDSYKSGQYNEAQLRTEFLDPFFKALGWDMDNTQGLAEAYKDVVHEDAIRIGGAVKAPDYCFRIGGTRKFFLEAKKPSVAISEETPAAYQLRRYAWSAKLPLSILSDFEEFAVYDCRIKPNKTDSASTARVFLCQFQNYADKWDWIASIFSKDAVLKGSFDKYAEENKTKRGTAEVDDDFLATIEHWRSELAKNLALRNSRLSQRELNFAVQRIIDRVIFLRICEDRGIELYGRLQALTNGPNIYHLLSEVFEDADAKYNSGLFHFKAEKGRHELPDEITLDLDVDDKLLRDLLRGLYYPESPYEFTVFSSDILGQVYEQFLGKVIRLTEGHRAVVEDKPEVKKAGGVYYTPTYIVDYIVKHTVGKLVEGKNPKQVPKLRILDPACGSGSFLINAYQFLLDWHHVWYLDHNPQSLTKGRDPVLVQTMTGWKLTITERKRILLNNIYGVDIDPQAVEVTKLSLLLKVLEGETEQTIQPYLRLFQQRALPDLGDNIKCGNSLIGPDFCSGRLINDAEELNRVNPFEWTDEFHEIMKAGGFTAIIGNPPYLKIEHISDADRTYLSKKYSSFIKRYDTFGVFVEKSIALLRFKGRFGMIIPSTILNNSSFSKLRRLLLESTVIETILNLGGKVFSGVSNDTLILIFLKSQVDEPNTVIKDVLQYGSGLFSATETGIKDLKTTSKPPNYVFELRTSEAIDSLFNKMKRDNPFLGEICNVFQGFVTGCNSAYIVNTDNIKKEKLERKFCKPAIFGDETPRYGRPQPKTFVIYVTKDSHLEDLPRIEARLLPYKALLLKKREVRMGKQPWYSMHWPRVQANFDRSPKILVQAIRNLSLGRRIMATLDSEGLYADHTLNVIYSQDDLYNLKYILGILNSRLVNFIFLKKYIDINIKGIYLADIPIRSVNASNLVSITHHDRIVNYVDRIMELHDQRDKARTPTDKELCERQIAAIDRQLDQHVYQLYGLSADEVLMVEEP